ncbi:MAG: glycerol-3-phosphate acyltransferase [Anaerolineales bacterium]|nr:glycerol-3-phosphate acyltransferase [Anaerolineales bacterium]
MNIQTALSSGWFFPLLAYLAGSLPFSLWISRLVAGIDIRDGGSGHASTTNTIRQVGWFPGVMVLILDIGKGFLPAYVAALQGYSQPVIILSATLSVVGHCWPIFAQFRGGMGLATAFGGFLAIDITGGLITLAVLICMILLYGHRARGSAAAGISIAPVLWLLGYRETIFWAALIMGWILAVRFYQQDWHREYKESWLDRKG